MNIVKMPSPNLADYPAMLRGLADEIEGGKLKPTAIMTVIESSGTVELRGWGDTGDTFRCLGMLEVSKRLLEAIAVDPAA